MKLMTITFKSVFEMLHKHLSSSYIRLSKYLLSSITTLFIGVPSPFKITWLRDWVLLTCQFRYLAVQKKEVV